MNQVFGGVYFLAMMISSLIAGALMLTAPLVLYAIYSRLGETNQLLRYLANCEAYRNSTTADPSA